MEQHPVDRRLSEVDGTQLSHPTTGDDQDSPILLVHGTVWGRVRQPALGRFRRCIAMDLPESGASAGELDPGHATVPAPGRTVLRPAEEIPAADLVEVAGRHIPTEDSPREVAEAITGHLTG